MTDWLLLRGLSREKSHWGEFQFKMEDQFGANHIHCLDLPGCGVYCDEVSPTDIHTIMEITRDRFTAKPKKPFIILAVSLGGMVAVDWQAHYPTEIAGLVLINTSMASVSHFYHRLMPSSLQSLLKVIRAENDEARELTILKLISNKPESELGDIAQEWTAIRKLRPVSLQNTLRQLYAAATYKPPANRHQKTAILLASLQDRMVSYHCSKAMSDAFDLPLYAHPWAGHDLTLDDPDWVIEKIVTNFPSFP